MTEHNLFLVQLLSQLNYKESKFTAMNESESIADQRMMHILGHIFEVSILVLIAINTRGKTGSWSLFQCL